jgi:hypothetical protein
LPYLYITKGISREDILAYIGIRIYMGLHKMPSIKHYWKRGLHQTKIYQIMSRNYFLLLGKVLHFPEREKDNIDIISENTKVDPRRKINLYLEKLSINFQHHFI